MKASDAEATQVRRTAARADVGGCIVPARDGRRELDLDRDVHALLGLVFDRMDLTGATAHVARCVQDRRRCFLSTPNVNFVVGAAGDPAFRGSVLRSDLSVADGFPIVRVARWMGIGLPGRVAGADLFEQLQARPRGPGQPPIRLFLFGGPPGVGALAAAKLNAQAGGFECVGHDEGGYGDIEAMSSQPTIDRINASGADFVLVALGARKGQAWIERNRARLDAPVISHLGAVINFAADSVARAPGWMQRAGLEWVWRIVQEPQLWRRYWGDGRVLVGVLVTRLAPWWVRTALGRRPAGTGVAPSMDLDRMSAPSVRVSLAGDWRDPQAWPPLRATLADVLREGRTAEFDLSAAPAVGSALLGLLCLVDAWQDAPRAVLSGSVRDAALRSAFRAHGVEHLLDAAPPQRGAGNQ